MRIGDSSLSAHRGWIVHLTLATVLAAKLGCAAQQGDEIAIQGRPTGATSGDPIAALKSMARLTPPHADHIGWVDLEVLAAPRNRRLKNAILPIGPPDLLPIRPNPVAAIYSPRPSTFHYYAAHTSMVGIGAVFYQSPDRVELGALRKRIMTVPGHDSSRGPIRWEPFLDGYCTLGGMKGSVAALPNVIATISPDCKLSNERGRYPNDFDSPGGVGHPFVGALEQMMRDSEAFADGLHWARVEWLGSLLRTLYASVPLNPVPRILSVGISIGNGLSVVLRAQYAQATDAANAASHGLDGLAGTLPFWPMEVRSGTGGITHRRSVLKWAPVELTGSEILVRGDVTPDDLEAWLRGDRG